MTVKEKIIMDMLALAMASMNPDDIEEFEELIYSHYPEEHLKFSKMSFKDLIIYQKDIGLRDDISGILEAVN